MKKITPAHIGVTLAFGGVAALIGSSGALQGAAHDQVKSVSARNMSVYMSAPIFAAQRESDKPGNWAEQQHKISFRLLDDGAMVDWWNLASALNVTGRRNYDLLEAGNIALLPELDPAAKPSLIVDGGSGCINLPPAATSSGNARYARGLLQAYEKAGKRAGTYAYVGEDADVTIMHVPLPASKTAAALCSEVRPVLHMHSHG